MTEREIIRKRRQRERERKVQAIKDLIAIILMCLFFITPSIVEGFINWLESVGLW